MTVDDRPVLKIEVEISRIIQSGEKEGLMPIEIAREIVKYVSVLGSDMRGAEPNKLKVDRADD